MGPQLVVCFPPVVHPFDDLIHVQQSVSIVLCDRPMTPVLAHSAPGFLCACLRTGSAAPIHTAAHHTSGAALIAPFDLPMLGLAGARSPTSLLLLPSDTFQNHTDRVAQWLSRMGAGCQCICVLSVQMMSTMMNVMS